MTQITSQIVAEKLSAYLHHEIALSNLVDWAEWAMMEGEFAPQNVEVIRNVVSRMGVADVKSFGLSWEDCEEFLSQLGYAVRIEVIAN